MSSRGWKSRIRRSAQSGSAEPPSSLGYRPPGFLLYPSMAEATSQLSVVSCIRALMAILRALLHLLKALIPNTITLGVRTSPMNLKGHRYPDYSTSKYKNP